MTPTPQEEPGGDRAVRLFPPNVAVRIQYPMLAAMVVLTCGAVALVLAP